MVSEALATCANVRLSELEREFADNGWRLSRVRGSHRVYTHEWAPPIILAEHIAPGGTLAPNTVSRKRREMARALEQREGGETAMEQLNRNVAATTKQCVACGKTKRLDEFGRHPRTLDGHKSVCSACIGKKLSEVIPGTWRARREQMAARLPMAPAPAQGPSNTTRLLDAYGAVPASVPAPALPAPEPEPAHVGQAMTITDWLTLAQQPSALLLNEMLFVWVGDTVYMLTEDGSGEGASLTPGALRLLAGKRYGRLWY